MEKDSFSRENQKAIQTSQKQTHLELLNSPNSNPYLAKLQEMNATNAQKNKQLQRQYK